MAIVSAVAASMLPLPSAAMSTKAEAQQVTYGLAITTGISFLTFGAAALFLLNLKQFKTGFQRAYYLISAGIAAQAVVSLGYVSFQYMTLWKK